MTPLEINKRGWAEPAGSVVSMPLADWFRHPEVQWDHIDGPLLMWRGQLHWLTWKERFMLAIGRTSIQQIAERRIT